MAIKKSYRQQMADLTRDTIIDIAIKQFKSKGFENVTISDIVSEAGMSRGSFYAHFRNKEDLLCSAIFQDMDNDYFEYYNEVILKNEEHLDPVEQLKRFLAMVNKVLTKHGPNMLRHYYSFIIGNTQILLRQDRHYLKILRYLTDLAHSQHLIKDGIDDDRLIDSILIMQRIAAIEWSMRDGEEPIEHWDYLIDTIIDRVRA